MSPRQLTSILAKPLLLARVISTLNSTTLAQPIPEARIPSPRMILTLNQLNSDASKDGGTMIPDVYLEYQHSIGVS